MRTLTFRGFLTQYVRSLSFSETNSLCKLAEEATECNPRLRAPLLLYAFFADKGPVLHKAAKQAALCAEFEKMSNLFDKDSLLHALAHGAPELSEEYCKVYRSYLVLRDKTKHDNHTKLLLLRKIQQLQTKQCVSNYRIYTDLGLNHGNVNAYLKHGDVTKVSLATARRALAYLNSMALSAHAGLIQSPD
jgi:hypothetical protein